MLLASKFRFLKYGDAMRFFVLSFLCLMGAAAAAAPVTWRLELVTLESGASASGSITYDFETNTASDWSLTISGSSDAVLNGTYSPANSYFVSAGSSACCTNINLNSNDNAVRLSITSSGLPMSDDGGVRFLVNGGTYLYDYAQNHSYLIQTGYLNTGTVGPSYSLCPLYDSSKAAKGGSAIPIKLQVCDAQGNNLSSSNLVLHAVSLFKISDSATGVPVDYGYAYANDRDFQYDATVGGTGGYRFIFSTKELPSGTYNLNFVITGDAFFYSTPLQVR